MNEYLNVKQVADKLGIQQVTVYKYLREGKFKGAYFKIGGIFRFDKALLEKHLDSMIKNN